MKHRVLVVEDNPLSRELLCDWLETQGYGVVSASSLKEAVAAVETVRPHVVLLDVQLGTEDGLSLASWMRQEAMLPHIPAIAVTAHAMVVEQERILQAGCTACVSKPVDFRLLQNQLQQWLAPADAGGASPNPGDGQGEKTVSVHCSKRGQYAQ